MKLFKILATSGLEELEGYGDDVRVKPTDKEMELTLLPAAKYAMGRMNHTIKPDA